jgi:hypothetical protein
MITTIMIMITTTIITTTTTEVTAIAEREAVLWDGLCFWTRCYSAGHHSDWFSR